MYAMRLAWRALILALPAGTSVGVAATAAAAAGAV